VPNPSPGVYFKQFRLSCRSEVTCQTAESKLDFVFRVAYPPGIVLSHHATAGINVRDSMSLPGMLVT
jgi:hypothetical protein